MAEEYISDSIPCTYIVYVCHFEFDTFVVPAGKFHNPKSCVCDPSFQRLLVDGSVDLGGDHALLTASCQDSHLDIGIIIIHTSDWPSTYFLEMRTGPRPEVKLDLLPLYPGPFQEHS